MKNRWAHFDQPETIPLHLWLRRVWSVWRPRVWLIHGWRFPFLLYKPLETWRSGWQDWRFIRRPGKAA